MPIYEYRCADCDRVTSLFVRSHRAQIDERCEHCGSERVSRVMSRVARLKTDADVLAEHGTPGVDAPSGAYEDPRQIGRWVERRFEQYGMDVPDETREMIDAARDGELPGPVSDL